MNSDNSSNINLDEPEKDESVDKDSERAALDAYVQKRLQEEIAKRSSQTEIKIQSLGIIGNLMIIFVLGLFMVSPFVQMILRAINGLENEPLMVTSSYVRYYQWTIQNTNIMARFTAAYAWFTMNKSVEVTGMQLKAQAEKGILINEKAGVSDGTWSEDALADSTVNALRPASTGNFEDWFHANSKKTNTETGLSGTSVDANTVLISGSNYYSDISPDNCEEEVVAATNDTNAAHTVYYTEGTGAIANTYDDGEGYYVKYTYYIKSSSNDGLNVSAGKLKATVTATLQGGGTAQALDKALRVGVQVAGDDQVNIFAPVANSTTTAYKVAGDTTGAAASLIDVTPIAGGTATGINEDVVALPKVTEPGLAVYVYVWFEGEDANCMSDNLAATLNAYQIDITFTDADLA